MKKKKKNKIPLSIPFWNTYKRRRKKNVVLYYIITYTYWLCYYEPCVHLYELPLGSERHKLNKKSTKEKKKASDHRGKRKWNLHADRRRRRRNKKKTSLQFVREYKFAFVFYFFNFWRKKEKKKKMVYPSATTTLYCYGGNKTDLFVPFILSLRSSFVSFPTPLLFFFLKEWTERPFFILQYFVHLITRWLLLGETLKREMHTVKCAFIFNTLWSYLN